MLLLVTGISGCLGAATAPTDGVPCIALKPLTDDLRTALIDHPETPKDVGKAAVKVVGGTEAVCR